ncbi:MAG: nucleotidyltransferase domain-containing protein [Planctomycetes bacterium]|nr:nucleotidyltransferase domain-containing protein [Planctomycetota bacterium]
MAHLSALERDALDELAKQIRERFGARVRRLVLFGSRARREGRHDSDLDVFALVDGLVRGERRAIQDLAFDIGLEHGLVISPIAVATESWRDETPLAGEIARDGEPL